MFSPRLRTGFSFRAAIGTTTEILSRLQEIGCEYAPITDRASTFGFVRWAKAAQKCGLRPIFGVEIAVSPSPQAKKPIVDYWTFLAKDNIASINRLLLTASTQFRYEPLLTYKQAMESEGVIRIVGRRALLDGLEPGADTYAAAAPSAAPAYLQQAQDRGFQLAACSDNVFPRPEDEGFYGALIGRGASARTYPQHILSEDEWLDAMRDRGHRFDLTAALATSRSIAPACHASLSQATMLRPERPASLRELCEANAPKLGIDLSDPRYAERLQRELEIIAEKQFEDYFYIVADMVAWARQRMTVGPARGSSAGSLVCFLLGITTVDPLKYGLVFERFIDLNRKDLPDIDIDFSDTKRDLVFGYVKEKYGTDRVARLGTVAYYKADGAMRETCGALGIPPWEAEEVMKSRLKRTAGDARVNEVLEDALKTDAGKRFLAKYPEAEIAARFEGHPRHYSQHAAGIVLTQEPIINYVAVDAKTGATHCDKRDAEALNLLKIDALGLIQLSIFEDTLRQAGLPHDHLDSVALDDPVVFDILNKRDYSGIFQVTGDAVKMLANAIRFDCLEDLIALGALGRPGPLASGNAREWVQRKAGKSPIRYPHPLFESILKDSLGVIVYQEQVMVIGREIGGLSWDEVTELRKAMGKSLGKDYFDQFGDRWKAGAIARGIPIEVANKVWNELCENAQYSFNRSHAVSYGLVSYYCAYLKAHYPLEFAAATLQAEGNPAKQIALLRELSESGIGYLPAHAELSTDYWTVALIDGKKHLIGPLHNIIGLGPKGVADIVGARRRGEPLNDRSRKRLLNVRTQIDTLWPIRDAIQRVLPNPRARSIISDPVLVKWVHDHEPNGQNVLIYGTFSKIDQRDENAPDRIEKRNGNQWHGPSLFLNLKLEDDTGELFAKVSCRDFDSIGREIIQRGRAKKCLYAVKGRLFGGGDFRGLAVNAVRYLGDMELDAATCGLKNERKEVLGGR